ncbi:DNA topoisomerase 4 subunit A [Humisphaera borealis]|uniref:DNA topoisomerase (ATP-hydrolyzing) n=1 Tax=Humisphaera borealis TaxID=2807512 RepID=A0A7M2X4C1_9BACT|nr:DNA topoisomerase 4 subunit A [Humisphaera borealis]
MIPPGGEDAASLQDIAQARYLNYALSVITSRALPDVRDGMKPVHRRIIYTMWQNGLRSTEKHRKCATVVGDVMGRYHPHGDGSIYEALVRMAQPFVMRATLVDGSGNFGSMDGDPAAAMRYTECRLTPIAAETIQEIGQGTVHFRPNYDGTREEPVVLPSKVPNLLLNGSTGIAVGMATNIPPHNLGEICNALLKVLDEPEIQEYRLVAQDAIRGPDFPTGGQVLNNKAELLEIYKTGQGAIKMRATWEKGPITRAAQVLYITSVPYGVNKAELVAAIAEVVISRKMPLLLDVKDISTDDVRIELQLKKDAEIDKVMAFLFKHTLLQTNFNVNLTCLVPTDNPEVCRPERLPLKDILWHFLHFRLEVVTKRLTHELEQLRKRIHTLEGFAFAFDILDDLIKIIRASEGKADAAARILKKYGIEPHGPRKPKDDGLDPEQVDDILELKLYRLARLEINLITDELAEKNKRAKEIKRLLDEEEATGRWGIVRKEIEELRDTYGKEPKNKRRTIIKDAENEVEYSAEDFIVAEDNHILVTADGWVKRQKEINPETTRLREGDRILSLVAGSTRATIVFFSNYGTAYTARIIDIPATTGYGEPIQKLFKLKDGEKIVSAISMDERVLPLKMTAINEKKPDDAPGLHGLAVTSDGYALRFGLDGYREVSTKSGRRYARPVEGAEVTLATVIDGSETVIAASQVRRVLLCNAGEINFLSGPGKGVLLIKLEKDDKLMAAITAVDDRDTLTVKTSMGGEQRLNTGRYKVTGRGGRGHEFVSRGQIAEVIYPPVTAPAALEGKA